MTLRNRFVCLLLFACQFILAQNDSINNLREVIVSDTYLKNFSNSKTILTLSDSIIKKNQPSLTSLLQYNSTIYFKENGLGMVSSPSFRGTTAQQTAVVWNGININSQLLGQTDFNTISVRDYNSISVRPGGGSSIYGSGAIGGSIHLNTDLSFKRNISNDLFLNYGSFNTFGLNTKISISDENTSLNMSISRNQSRNDYDYLDTDLKNENGQFENTSLNVGFGYKLNSKSILKLYSQFYYSDRNFPINSISQNKTNYLDTNYRNLLSWNFTQNKISTQLDLAFLSEKYNYFPDIRTDKFEFGKVETIISNYRFGYEVKKNLKLSSTLSINQNKGYGSNIVEVKRQIFSASFGVNHQLSKVFDYELIARKEATENYKSPFLFSFGSTFKASKFYSLKINGSKNFRIPTFNDLYYGSFGNPNLVPETALQLDIINEVNIKKLRFSVTGFYIKTTNLIQWLERNGKLKPENLTNATNYGLEAYGNYSSKINDLNLRLASNYGYTKAIDDSTNLQLTFVPYHKLNSEIELKSDAFSIQYQHLFTGFVFTTTDHFDSLKSFQVSTIGIYFATTKKTNATLGFQIQNIFNQNYKTTVNRPMPGRNYTINLNLIL